MNDLDKLIRHFEGADYFDEPSDGHYSLPATWFVWITFWTAGVTLMSGIYLLYLAAQAWLG